jgi:hypothetical protein
MKKVIIDGVTVGSVDESVFVLGLDSFIGKKIAYEYHDENGNKKLALGVLTEILD